MQTTDLFLGLTAGSRLKTTEPFPLKAETVSATGSSFKAMFAGAIDQRRTSMFQARNDGPVSQRWKTAERPAAAQTADSGVRAQERKDQADDAARTAEAAGAKSQPASEPENGARSEKAETGRTETGTAKTGDAVKAEKQPAAEAKAPAGNESAGAGKADADAGPDNSELIAEAGKAAAEQSDLNARLEALIAKLELEAADGELSAGEEIAEIIAEIIAVLLADMNKATEAVEGQPDGVTVRLDVDPDGRVSELMDMLLNGKESMSGAELKDVKVLLKLGENKGLAIPLSEIVRGEADEAGAVKITIQLADSTGNQAANLNLAISAEDIKAAQLVDLSRTPAIDSGIVLTIPIEKLAEASGIETLETLKAKLAQGDSDSKTLKLLDATGLTKRELADALSTKENSTGRIKVAIPLQSGKSDESGKPVIMTSDPAFIQSDQYMKALEMEALAKEITQASKDRREIFDRLQKLLLDSPDGGGAEKLLTGRTSGLLYVKDWLENFSDQAKKESAEWTANLFKEASAKARPESAAGQTASERIPFLGRIAQAETMSQVVNSRSETPHPAPGRELDESVMRQFVQKLSYSFINGTSGEVRVVLRPESLGDIHLKVRVDQETIVAKITARSAEVKAIIENNLGQLKDALEQQGVRVGKFEVAVNTGDGGNNAQNGAEDRTGDAYLGKYAAAGAEQDSIAGTGAEAALFDGDFYYSRSGVIPGISSQHSYLA